MQDDTKPWAIKGCFNGSNIMAIQIGVESKKALRRDWLNVIGDEEYAEQNDCQIYVPETQEPGLELVIVFISIGFEEKKGVNFVSFVFAPDYDNEDSEMEFSFTVGVTSPKMDFVNIAFT